MPHLTEISRCWDKKSGIEIRWGFDIINQTHKEESAQYGQTL